MAKLTQTDVDDIRRRYRARLANQYELAREFGVHQTTIGRIVRDERWK